MARISCLILSVCFCFGGVLSQFSGFQNYYQNERYASQNPRQSIFNFVPSTVTRLAGVIHLNQETSVPKGNAVSFPTDNRPTELRPVDTQYDQYGRPVYNGFNQYQYPQQNGFNQYLPNNGFTNVNNQNGFDNGPYPYTQLNPVANGNINDHYVFPNNQNNQWNSEGNSGNPSTDYNQPPVFSGDDTEAGKLEDKNGQIDIPEEPKTDEFTTTTGLPALTPVANEARSAVNFAQFQETCDTVDGNIGSCLVIAECPQYAALLKSARNNPSAVQLLRRAHCGFQGNTPKVCCPRAGIPTAPPITLPTAPTFTTTTPSPARPEPVHMPDNQNINVFLEPPVCGFSNASLGRVVGGEDAKLADFPWMALLGYKDRGADTPSWKCGGSLVTAQHVLTAAHCINNHENDLYIVRLGELDLARDDDGASPIDVPIRQKIKHEEYNAKAFTNDIGILVLDRQVEFTDLIRPICMPKDSELRARNFVDYKPIIAGWGDTEFRGPSATHLQALQLPVVSNEFCANAYRNYKSQKIDERVLCAGFKKGGKDACQGDSGGPLMQPIWNSETRITYFYQIGVVSFGRKCAEAGYPGVYSRVTTFIPWLEKTLRNN